MTRPLLFENLFVGGSEELNAEAVKASLSFPQSMSDEEGSKEASVPFLVNQLKR